MRISSLLVALSFGLVVACASDSQSGMPVDTDASSTSGTTSDSTSTPPVDTKPWDVETETNPPSMPTSAADGDVSGTGGANTTDGQADDVADEEGEDEGGEESFIGMFGIGSAVPGESYAPSGEAIAFVAGVDECVVLWQATAVVDETCTECDYAFQLTIDTTEVEADVDCMTYGFAPDQLLGESFSVGFSGEETLHLNEGEGWATVEEGFAEFVQERGTLEFEFPVEP